MSWSQWQQRYRPKIYDWPGCPPYVLSEAQLDELEEMSIYQCTQNEMANVFGVTRKTWWAMAKRQPEINRRIAIGQARGRRALRSVQFKVALSGNTTMLMFLGRCYLDQDPDGKIQINGSGGILELSEETRNHLQELAKHLAAVAGQPEGPERIGNDGTINRS